MSLCVWWWGVSFRGDTKFLVCVFQGYVTLGAERRRQEWMRGGREGEGVGGGRLVVVRSQKASDSQIHSSTHKHAPTHTPPHEGVARVREGMCGQGGDGRGGGCELVDVSQESLGGTHQLTAPPSSPLPQPVVVRGEGQLRAHTTSCGISSAGNVQGPCPVDAASAHCRLKIGPLLVVLPSYGPCRQVGLCTVSCVQLASNCGPHPAGKRCIALYSCNAVQRSTPHACRVSPTGTHTQHSQHNTTHTPPPTCLFCPQETLTHPRIYHHPPPQLDIHLTSYHTLDF